MSARRRCRAPRKGARYLADAYCVRCKRRTFQVWQALGPAPGLAPYWQVAYRCVVCGISGDGLHLDYQDAKWRTVTTTHCRP